MTLYQIYSAVDNEEAYVDLKQDDRKIVEFINYNRGNYTDEAVFIAQGGYTSKNISNTDYIQTIPKMLLFSETFIINDDLIWAFSDKFKELVVSNNLKMEFLPLT